MAEAPAPTYRSDQRGDREVYVCIVPDANHASGTCDHWSPTYDLMAQHQQQRHGGDMVEAPPEEAEVSDPDGPQSDEMGDDQGASSASTAAASASVETATPAPPPPPPTPTSQRTADAQEHPPQASVG